MAKINCPHHGKQNMIGDMCERCFNSSMHRYAEEQQANKARKDADEEEKQRLRRIERNQASSAVGTLLLYAFIGLALLAFFAYIFGK